jgi:trimethylamine:corrinoid methyltransferase-like protein
MRYCRWQIGHRFPLENRGGFGLIELTERKASIQPIKSKLRIRILDDEDVEKINQTALTILEEVGIEIPSEKALKVFADAGANVDFDRQTVRIGG